MVNFIHLMAIIFAGIFVAITDAIINEGNIIALYCANIIFPISFY